MADDDPFLTVAEIAELLKLNQQTVRNWIDAGTLPAIHVGRRVRIKRADYDALIAARATGTASTVVQTGPTADDFWSGQAVGEAVVAKGAGKA